MSHSPTWYETGGMSDTKELGEAKARMLSHAGLLMLPGVAQGIGGASPTTHLTSRPDAIGLSSST